MLTRHRQDDFDDNDINEDYANQNIDSNIESSSTIAGGGGGMTVAAATIQTVTSTIVDGIVHTVAHWKVILLGQIISIILAISGGTSDVLALECGVSAPSTYNALGYTLVAIFGCIRWRRSNRRNKRINNNVGDHNNEAHNRDDDEEEETTSFRGGGGSGSNREGSFVGDLYLENDNNNNNNINNDEDFDYNDDDDVDDLTLDESIINRSSFFSLRRNINKYHQETNERYPPPIHQKHRHHPHNRSTSDNNSVKLESHHHGTTSLTAANAANHLLLPPAKWYYYFAVALVEAQAFYFIFLAFRYTSFTFVYVSDALAIPSAMVFSRLFMRRKYLWTHILGCFICITGIVVNTASDINNDAQNNNGGGGGGGGLNDVLVSLDHVKGDIFAILGAVLLGLDDVLSEMILDNYRGGVSKMLFMKGVFGALISLIQLGMFERDNVYLLFGVDDEGGDDGAPCDFSWRMMLLTAHVVSRALGVAGEMQFLFISEAALLNILLLTSDLIAAFFDILTIGFRLTPYFCFAFLCIVIGIVLYEAGPSPASAAATAGDRILGAGGTPITIEFRDRGGRRKTCSTMVTSPMAGGAAAEGATSSSLMSTEHAGNLTPHGMERVLT